MRLHAVQAYMPVLLAGVSFTIPVNTKLITGDANGDIHAWVCYPEEVECHHEFWCSETSDGIFLGRVDDWSNWEWTRPLWQVGEVNPLSLQFQITQQGITASVYGDMLGLTDVHIAKIRFLIDQVLNTTEYSIKIRTYTPNKLGMLQKAFKIESDTLYYGESFHEGVFAYTSVIPFDEIAALSNDLILEGNYE